MTASSASRLFLCTAVIVGAAAATAPGGALAAVGRVEFAIGDVRGIDADGLERRLVKGSGVDVGDTVRTGDGRAQIRFTDGGYTSLQPETEFRIDDYRFERDDEDASQGFFSLLKGGLRTITGIIGRARKKAYRLTTPVATIGIRGTEYLASLENSLLVHVGDGEIEVCTTIGCSDFGPHATGYVPDDLSRPVQVKEPPTLSPPQEKQVFALADEYQNEVDALREYSRNDDVNADGTADVFGGRLPDGQLYALAVAYGANLTLVDLFATGLLDPPGELVDARFDDAGALVSYFSPDSGRTAPIEGDIQSAQAVEVGTAAGVIGWGRWRMGTAKVGKSGGGFTGATFTNERSHHYAVGIPTADMPSGSATYSLLGATSPTFANAGSAGTVHDASLFADFDAGNVGFDMTFSLAGDTYTTDVDDMAMGSGPNRFTFGGGGITTTPAGGPCGIGCSTTSEGFFAGAGASHAGLSYKVQLPTSPSPDYITGAAAFEKD